MTNLDSTAKYVEFYLEKLRQGEFEAAFHGLTEAGRSVIPCLVDAFRQERSPSIRAELVSIIWNHRRPEAAGFLAEALNDLDPKVWKSALDGLVTLASPAALQILQAASNRELPNKKQTEEFRKWVSEAIAQVQEAIATGG
jgi:HEAT repeat protein